VKLKMYSAYHEEECVEEMDNEKLFSQNEYKQIFDNEPEKYLPKKDAVLSQFFLDSPFKMHFIGHLCNFIIKNDIKTICSLGCGQGEIEYIMKSVLPSHIKLAGADFIEKMIENNQKNFPEVKFAVFDFTKDKMANLFRKTGFVPELLMFLGSASCMDDQDFVRQFKAANDQGVRWIIDGHATCYSFFGLLKIFLRNKIRSLANKYLWLKLFILRIKPDYKFAGKHHAFARNKKELEELYKKAKWEIAGEDNFEHYRYTAILKRK
jgi:hypothetical protein